MFANEGFGLVSEITSFRDTGDVLSESTNIVNILKKKSTSALWRCDEMNNSHVHRNEPSKSMIFERVSCEVAICYVG